ncbi:MAG: hypothetical protein CMF60_06860 [Magnetococcales bacterium]|nr:hypothetical protein [Magnetococcales bacterium]MEC8067566.1 hypothetical protein [Pseudomonadota bacterium]|tara:strand:+ start:7455 stop:7661 length:207 start_codon:yes stop_codon:yes gene_type:complete
MEIALILLAIAVAAFAIWSSYKVGSHLQKTYKLNPFFGLVIMLVVLLSWWPLTLLLYFAPKLFKPDDT